MGWGRPPPAGSANPADLHAADPAHRRRIALTATFRTVLESLAHVEAWIAQPSPHRQRQPDIAAAILHQRDDHAEGQSDARLRPVAAARAPPRAD